MNESNAEPSMRELDVRQASWPSVVGFVSIVYAIIALFSNVVGMAAPFLMPVGLRMAGVDMEPDMGLPSWMSTLTLVFGVLGILLAILLVVGAIGLIRRSASGVALMKLWSLLAVSMAVLAIVFGFFSIEQNIDLQLEIQTAFQDLIREQNPDDPEGAIRSAGLDQDEESMKEASIRNLAVIGTMPLVYPLLLGVFLTSKRRMQEVGAWN
ncbi:MAG: hypothetical protein VX012_08595 [Planctomycetota bacterium]|nr:hypothetical protein [Planctomycetota bacterium]